MSQKKGAKGGSTCGFFDDPWVKSKKIHNIDRIAQRAEWEQAQRKSGYWST
ncbi:hypothetical protein M0R72_19910 [Candidatus Pacearchaeota archaeon]|nr:hypothetical protein [Candidatus Pacearchaeota archaeon]